MARPRLAAAALAVALLAGCSSDPAPEPAPLSAEAEPMHPEHTAEPIPDAVWDADARQLAANAAEAAITAFTRKDLVVNPDDPDNLWWWDFRRYLTDEAEPAYKGTDPRNVPGTRVIDSPAVLPETASPYLATVDVATDGGQYRVLLVRFPESELPNPWLVDRILPPAEHPGHDE